MRIAVVGAGISGLTAAWLLSRNHEVHVFEADTRIGGHTHTVQVDDASGPVAVDTGFIVFNRPNYPLFSRLLDYFDVASQPTSMSFSVRCDRDRLEYNGTSLNCLFAQRRNLLRPSFYRMIRGILRFHREGPAVAAVSSNLTVGEFIAQRRYPAEFARHFLLPMGSALWSCPTERFAAFPIQFVAEFMHHHRMLQTNGRPEWRVIRGGSRQYIARLTAGFHARIHTGEPVSAAFRTPQGIRLQGPGRDLGLFDEVVLACHADQARAIVAQPSPQEDSVLREFPYETNVATLHTSDAVMPARRRAWASWNFRLSQQSSERATVTYYMNMLQSLSTETNYFVTLNDSGDIPDHRILRRIRYTHPLFTPARDRAQERHTELIRHDRISYCGAYWGFGFHEDGVRSAVRVAEAFGETMP